jgi:RNA-directed DNA polymerase
VMNAIYERDFLGFNYGFRPGRSQHMALDALAVGVTRRRVNWVLDADIRSFFDTMEQGWIVKFVEHRIADRRVVRLIQKWLRAGVLEEGKHIVPEEGAVQGGSISPLLSNLYLHYVLDLWVQKWRQTRAHGGVAIVRFADDFVMGFERKDEAEQFLVELKERFLKFGLELHPEKTRLIEFGRKPYEQRKARGKRRPETFNFLGFKHCCAQNGRGYFVILRQTMGSRMSAKLKALKEELRRRWHLSVPEQGQYLQAVLAGHYRYYGVPYNSRALRTYRHRVVRIWRRALIRRGGKRRPNWAAIAKHAARWLPQPRIHHPYPSERFAYE